MMAAQSSSCKPASISAASWYVESSCGTEFILSRASERGFEAPSVLTLRDPMAAAPLPIRVFFGTERAIHCCAMSRQNCGDLLETEIAS